MIKTKEFFKGIYKGISYIPLMIFEIFEDIIDTLKLGRPVYIEDLGSTIGFLLLVVFLIWL